ncbi:MAG: hypothetical protein WCB27_06755 [Thermoguttaceae bacterium]
MAQRVVADQSQVTFKDGGMHFFVETGSTAEPIVCLADNSMGAATFRLTVYAKGATQGPMKGIKVDLWFPPMSGPLKVATGGVAINVEQPGMLGPFGVHPA